MPGESATETPEPTPTAGNATDSGGLVPSIDPAEFFLDGIRALGNSLASGVVDLLGAFNGIVFGINPPGRSTNIESWGPPESGLWIGAWELYWVAASLGIALLLFQAMRAQGQVGDRDTMAKFAEIAKCAVLILAGWPIAIGGLHLADTMAMALAPDASALLGSPANIGKLGFGVAVGLLLVVVQTASVLTAIVVVLIERFLLVMAVATWPLWWGLRPSDSGFANAASGIGLSMFVGVAGAKVLQAALAFLVFNSEWGAGGVDATVMSLVGSAVGLGVTFVGVPLIVGRNFVPEVMTVLGTPGVRVAENHVRQARERGAGAAKAYGASARSRVSDATPNGVPSPSWSRGGSDTAGRSQSVPDDYSPTPEPGAAPASRSSPDADGGLPGGMRTMQQRRIDALDDRARD